MIPRKCDRILEILKFDDKNIYRQKNRPKYKWLPCLPTHQKGTPNSKKNEEMTRIFDLKFRIFDNFPIIIPRPGHPRGGYPSKILDSDSQTQLGSKSGLSNRSATANQFVPRVPPK